MLLAAVASWSGLCALLVEFASSEISASAGKKRGPDASIPKTLKRLVQLAEDDRRSGNTLASLAVHTSFAPSLLLHSLLFQHATVISKQCALLCLLASLTRQQKRVVLDWLSEIDGCLHFPGRRGLLVRKAAKLFTHAKDVIQQTSLASPLGQEYSALLRNSLLTVPQYCDAAGAVVFQGTEALLRCCPHKVAPDNTATCKIRTSSGQFVSNVSAMGNLYQPHICALQSFWTSTWADWSSTWTDQRIPFVTYPPY